jgi:hypothetical protein
LSEQTLVGGSFFAGANPTESCELILFPVRKYSAILRLNIIYRNIIPKLCFPLP